MADGEAGHIAQYLKRVDGGDGAVAVDVSPDGGDVLADVGAGFGLGDGELCDVTQLLKGVHGGDAAVAVDVALGALLTGAGR